MLEKNLVWNGVWNLNNCVELCGCKITKSSMLEKNLVWNGGWNPINCVDAKWRWDLSESVLYGVCDKRKYKKCMEWGVCLSPILTTEVLQKEPVLWDNSLQVVLKVCVLLCVMGCLLLTLVTQQCVEWGVNPTVKSTQSQYGCLRISIYEHGTPLFGQDAPPGLMAILLFIGQGPLIIIYWVLACFVFWR